MDFKTQENAFAIEVMEHYGYSFEGMAAELQETGCGFDFLIGRTEDAETNTGNVIDAKAGKRQKIVIDFDPDYGYFLIRKIRPAPGETQETPGASEN